MLLPGASRRAPLCDRLFVAPGNPGTAQHGTNVVLDVADHRAVIDFCRTMAIDFVVVGPEAPLVAGLVDDLRAAGIKAFGPSKAAAQLEGSKAFTKDLCAEFGIPTAAYRRFTDAEAAKSLYPQLRRAHRREGRRPCGRQGRRGRHNLRGGGGRHRHDARRRPRARPAPRS